jgi:PAS domain S-box-containing protein
MRSASGRGIFDLVGHEDTVLQDSLFRMLVASARDAVIAKTLDGTITTWNAAAEKLFGYAHAEIVGRPILTLFPPERVPEEVQLLEQVGRGEYIDTFETVRIRKDGTLIDVSVTLSPIVDDGGKIVGASKIARDITQWRAQRGRLQRLQRLTAALNSGLTVDEIAHLTMRFSAEALGAEVATFSFLSHDGTEILTNHALGLELDDLGGLRRAPISADLGAAIAVRDRRPFSMTSEEQYRAHFASPGWINPYRGGSRISVPVIWDGRGIAAINLGFSAWREFSDADLAYAGTIASQCAQALQRARAFDAEHKARAVAERNVRLREDMLAVVSHDLRSPLATVVLTASSLASSVDEEVARPRLLKYAENLRRSAEQMKRLIDDLLDLSSIDAGVFKVDREDHALKNVIDESLATFQPLAAKRGIRLTADVPNVVVSCDAARTVQVLGNLLSNAIKFTAPDGEVSIECSVEDTVVIVAVRDTGPGIAAENLPRIFDRYWRTEQKYRGAGLGLAIAKGIVEVQGGTIGVESTVGVGSTFSFSLPLARDTPASRRSSRC